jgi:phosphoserine aminotransferase
MEKPKKKPLNPCFSSGPCPKRPGWEPEILSNALLGRSHRSESGKARLQNAIEQTKEVLEVPEDYRIGIVAGSDTGAVEMALWNLLGERAVQVLAWESFGQEWVTDIVEQLEVPLTERIIAPYGQLPDLQTIDFSRDVVFVWNGTTSGTKVPDGDWIPSEREGLSICDATSAAFAMELPWGKLDVVTFSWQKVLGGEAAHGMLILSPKAVKRLESYKPPRPLPKIFRLTKDGRLNESIFRGATINTPSMLCVEDYLDALQWALEQGGLKGLIERSKKNLLTIESWVARTPWVEFLTLEKTQRSSTSICLRIIAKWFVELDDATQRSLTAKFSGLLEKEGVAYDIDGYRNAPPGLRIWGGATVEASDLESLTDWLDWGYEEMALVNGVSG